MQPLKLPKGTTLAMQFTFDNSAANPRNPQQPPVRVRWGQRSRDEMGDLWIQALPGSENDLNVLEQMFRPKVMAEDTIGYEREIERDENDIGLHDDVAQLYLNIGRPEEAVKHFAASARLNASSPSTHFNLGTALIVAGRAEEAKAEFDRALAIRPDYAQAHNNLGSIFLAQGRTAEALVHFREALRIEPANVEAYSNLGTALAATGDFQAAVDALQRASRLSPAEPLASSIRERLALYRAGPDVDPTRLQVADSFQWRRVPRLRSRTSRGTTAWLAVALAKAAPRRAYAELSRCALSRFRVSRPQALLSQQSGINYPITRLLDYPIRCGFPEVASGRVLPASDRASSKSA